jgi:hypothetical protein
MEAIQHTKPTKKDQVEKNSQLLFIVFFEYYILVLGGNVKHGF